MSTAFHINPETGNPGRCTAQPGNCKYGESVHYETEEIARLAFEESMKEDVFTLDVFESSYMNIPADELEFLHHAIEQEYEASPVLVEHTKKALEYCVANNYKWLGTGTTRACFESSDNTVIKVPINWEGQDASNLEVEFWKIYSEEPEISEIPVAECQIIRVPGSDIPLLEMEKVRLPDPDEVLPRWTNRVDCAQVGYNAKGELVAYDL